MILDFLVDDLGFLCLQPYLYRHPPYEKESVFAVVPLSLPLPVRPGPRHPAGPPNALRSLLWGPVSSPSPLPTLMSLLHRGQLAP